MGNVRATAKEVKYRDVEMARIFNSDRVNCIHRARDDSGQNEAERSNACIGKALVDGGAMRWQYYETFDRLTDEEIPALSLDVKNRNQGQLVISYNHIYHHRRINSSFSTQNI